MFLRSINSIELTEVNYSIYPADDSTIHERNPNIKLQIRGELKGRTFKEIQVYLDNKEEVLIPYKDDTIEITPACSLEFGQHKLHINIVDTKGNIFEIRTRFFVDDKFQEYNIYYGNLHSHTSYSDGVGTPTDAFEYAIKNKLDFLAVTDHVSKLLKSNVTYDNDTEVLGLGVSKWELTKLESDRINSKYSEFLAIPSYEQGTMFIGHLNIFNSLNIGNKYKFKLKDLYDFIARNEEICICINHPFKHEIILRCTPFLNKYINLIEVGNGSPPRIYKRAEREYYNYLDEGWTLGAVNGQDNHINNWGETENLSGIMAKELSYEAIMEALIRRRVYSTESRTLKIKYKMNGYEMGNIINIRRGSKLSIQVEVADNVNTINRVELVVNGGKVLKMFMGDNNSKMIIDTVLDVNEKITWYLIKVTHANNSLSFSSPIFTKLY